MMTTATCTLETNGTKKKSTVFRKVLAYLQHQALEQSSSRDYLTPPGGEPQQHQRHHQGLRTARTSSDAAVEGSLKTDTKMGSRTFSCSHDIKRVQYAHENLLQSYEVYIPEPNPQQANKDKYWILYIHGGYFRDPKVDASSFRPALELLAESSPTIAEETESATNNIEDFFSIQHKIAGFASINYRLAPHVAHPQDPETTPRYELRNARWPEQIDDILAALRHLQSKHNFGSQYILSGHSVGAQLAFLAALKSKDAGIPLPRCVIGCNGIYDFPRIHTTNPAYENMTRNAMKPEFYVDASPALHSVRDYVSLREQGLTNFVLSHSRDDGLVGWDQVEIMKKVLDDASTFNDGDMNAKSVRLIETTGSHNLTWEEGKVLAGIIKEGLNMVST